MYEGYEPHGTRDRKCTARRLACITARLYTVNTEVSYPFQAEAFLRHFKTLPHFLSHQIVLSALSTSVKKGKN